MTATEVESAKARVVTIEFEVGPEVEAEWVITPELQGFDQSSFDLEYITEGDFAGTLKATKNIVTWSGSDLTILADHNANIRDWAPFDTFLVRFYIAEEDVPKLDRSNAIRIDLKDGDTKTVAREEIENGWNTIEFDPNDIIGELDPENVDKDWQFRVRTNNQEDIVTVYIAELKLYSSEKIK